MAEHARGPERSLVAPASLPTVLRTLNRMRGSADATLRAEADSLAETLFGAGQRLIAYGSLMPGGRHDDQLAGLRGTWRPGWVTGALVESGWGAVLGYPALRWSAESDHRVESQLFISADLHDHWDRLDRFEGEAYRRILAPFYDDAGFVAVGNLYEIAPQSV